MADEVKAASDVTYRDYVTPGLPSSGAHKVLKAAIRALFDIINGKLNLLEATVAGGRIGAATYAALAAITTKPAGTVGEVPSDAGTHTDPITGTPLTPNAGVYVYVTGVPNGWQRIDNYRALDTASQAEVDAEVVTTKAVSPATLAAKKWKTKETVWLEYVSGLNNAQVLKVMDPRVTLTGDLRQYRFRTEAAVESGFGNVAYRIMQYDGVTEALASTSAFIDDNPVGTGEVQVGDIIDFARNSATRPLRASQLRIMLPPDVASAKIEKTIIHLAEFGKNPTEPRPVAFLRAGRNTDFITIRPHPLHYTGGQVGQWRGSDMSRFVQFNMRDFQQDPDGSPAINSLFGRWAARPVHDCNLLFTQLDSGLTVDTGQVPSTVEPPIFVNNFTTQTAAQAAISGNGHGYLADTEWTMFGRLNDASTGTILAATKSNPLTLRLNINPYTVGSKFIPRGVVGMTQINDVELTVTAVSTTVSPNDTVTIGAVNSTAYGTFTGHTGGIDRDSADFHLDPVNSERFFDRIITTFTGLNTTTAAEPTDRFTYTTTYESVAGHTMRLHSRFDFGDPDVVITPGFVRAFACLWIGTDLNRCRGIYAGVPGPILTIDKRDDTSTLLGYPDAVIFWHSDFPEHQIKVTNEAGPGNTHWQDDGGGLTVRAGGVGLSAESYISNFDWGIKLYGWAFGSISGADEYNFTDKVIETEMTVLIYMGDPQA